MHGDATVIFCVFAKYLRQRYESESDLSRAILSKGKNLKTE